MSFVKAVTASGSTAALIVTCLLTAAGTVPAAIGRASTAEPVFAWAIPASIMYGVTIIASFTPGVRSAADVWAQVVGWLLLTTSLSSVALAFVGATVVPVSAARLMATGMGRLLHDTSQALDRCVCVAVGRLT
jgi:hypothetical protein